MLYQESVSVQEQFETNSQFESNRNDLQNFYFQTTEEIQDEKRKPAQQIYADLCQPITEQHSVEQLQCEILQNLCSKIPVIDKKVKKCFPSSTKNIGKNFAQAFKAFLNSTLSPKIKTQYSIRKFLKSSPKELGLQNFSELINSSSQLTQLAEYYFGQFGWTRTFMMNNKTNLEQYYSFHSIWRTEEQ